MDRRTWICLLLSSLPIATATAQESVAASGAPAVAAPNDAVFAPGGHADATLATGLPYVAIGEVAYGVTSRFTVGAMAGVTPDSPGYGLRLRGVLFERGPDRVFVISPLLYYPASAASGGEPWVLAMPQVLAEHRFQGGATLHAGLGAAAATCTGALESLLVHGDLRHDDDDGNGGGFMGDVWATATVGGAIPVARATSLFSDVTVVSSGLVFDRHWVGTIPIVATAGVEHTF